MNKEEALKKISESDTEDFQVFTKDEHETFLTNYKETEVSKGINESTSMIHQRYEDDVKSILGVEKPREVKTYDFIKNQLSTLTSDIQSKEAKIAELEKAVNDKSGDEALKLAKSELDAFKQKHQKALDEFKSKSESQSKEIQRIKMMNHADHSLMGIKFLSSVPEDARKALIEIAKNDVINEASILDNTVVFLDENGEPKRDDQYKIITMESRLKEKLKSIIDEGRKQEGVKIGDPEVGKDEDGNIVVSVVVPDTIKTMEQLINHLQEAGLKRGSEEYYAALKKYSEQFKLI